MYIDENGIFENIFEVKHFKQEFKNPEELLKNSKVSISEELSKFVINDIEEPTNSFKLSKSLWYLPGYIKRPEC